MRKPDLHLRFLAVFYPVLLKNIRLVLPPILFQKFSNYPTKIAALHIGNLLDILIQAGKNREDYTLFCFPVFFRSPSSGDCLPLWLIYHVFHNRFPSIFSLPNFLIVQFFLWFLIQSVHNGGVLLGDLTIGGIFNSHTVIIDSFFAAAPVWWTPSQTTSPFYC